MLITILLVLLILFFIIFSTAQIAAYIVLSPSPCEVRARSVMENETRGVTYSDPSNAQKYLMGGNTSLRHNVVNNEREATWNDNMLQGLNVPLRNNMLPKKESLGHDQFRLVEPSV